MNSPTVSRICMNRKHPYLGPDHSRSQPAVIRLIKIVRLNPDNLHKLFTFSLTEAILRDSQLCYSSGEFGSTLHWLHTFTCHII